ncbi:uncharacterized protein LOC144100627 [Amblyomma americanum]
MALWALLATAAATTVASVQARDFDITGGIHKSAICKAFLEAEAACRRIPRKGTDLVALKITEVLMTKQEFRRRVRKCNEVSVPRKDLQNVCRKKKSVHAILKCFTHMITGNTKGGFKLYQYAFGMNYEKCFLGKFSPQRRRRYG